MISVGDESNLVSHLNSTIGKLQRENAARRVAYKEALSRLEKLEVSYKDLESKLSSVAAERDEFKHRLEVAPVEAETKVKALETQIRRIGHKEAFSKVLTGRLHPKATVEDVWSKVGYEPGEGMPTDEEVKTIIAKAEESAGFLFVESPSQGGGAPRNGESVAKVAPPHGNGRYAAAEPPSLVRYKRSDVAYPGWEFDRPELVTALAQGRAQAVDVE